VIVIMSTNENTMETATQSAKGATYDYSYDDVSTVMRNPWDPLHCADWDVQQPKCNLFSTNKT